MKVTITVSRDQPESGPLWNVSVRTAGTLVAHRTIPAHVDTEGRWWPARADSGDAAVLPGLSGRLADRSATAADVLTYGRLLFDFLLGQEAWAVVRDRADPADVLEFRLSWPVTDGALHRMVWELMHDGEGHLALSEDLPVVFLREVPESKVTVEDRPIRTIPRVLFAVGSLLTDPRIRPGAEFMGVLRALQRGGGAIRQRVLTDASLAGIGQSCAEFQPQIVHLIGHGRWDELASRAVLELRSDENTAARAEVTGPELFGALAGSAPPPVAVVISACESGVAYSEGGAPLAATLVADGVPVVIAMAGDVADTACRLFTRSVAASVSDGTPLARAVREGRRVAFRRKVDDLNPFDWALPALFVTPEIAEGFTLVDTAASRMIRDKVCQLGLDWTPVFYGRDEFFQDLDRLLDPADGLAVLAAQSDDGAAYGGTRLLRELAAAAVRAGHLPCLIGPFVKGRAPTTVRTLALKITNGVLRLRKTLGVDQGWQSATLAQLAAGVDVPAGLPPAAMIARLERLARLAPDDMSIQEVTDPLREDLFTLAADAAAMGGPFAAACRPLLLLDDVHLYDHALDALAEEGGLGPAGFGAGSRILPTVLFGKVALANEQRLAGIAATNVGGGWWSLRDVRNFRELALRNNSEEDLLAYQWWYLNPAPATGGPATVLAPRRVANNLWAEVARLKMEESHQVYDPVRLSRFAKFAVERAWFTTSTDDEILRAYGIIT
ncbi:CHAT domain-containing protein [Actinoplanes sp. GCM10030250]|uniref:CHAT domain-containing protein n=1 Tax=Actinoplanes sp. GCM10030250 TaxID=3273376 RepID=UPI0036209413